MLYALPVPVRVARLAAVSLTDAVMTPVVLASMAFRLATVAAPVTVTLTAPVT